MDEQKVQHWSLQKVEMYKHYDWLRHADYDTLFNAAKRTSKINGLVYKGPDSDRRSLIATIIEAQFGGVEKIDAAITKYGGNPNKYKEYAEGRFEKSKPGRTAPVSNRMSWTPEQYTKFLEHAKGGSTFRSTIDSLAKGDDEAIFMLQTKYPQWKRWFIEEHPYPGMIRLLDLITQQKGVNGDFNKIIAFAKQIQSRIKRLYDFARTAKAISIVKSYRGIR